MYSPRLLYTLALRPAASVLKGPMTRTTNFRSSDHAEFSSARSPSGPTAPGPAKAFKPPRSTPFTAALHPTSPPPLSHTGQSLSAIAEESDFIANEVSGGIRVELNQNLDLQDVKTTDGKTAQLRARLQQHPRRHRFPLRSRRHRHKKSRSSSTTLASSPAQDNLPSPRGCAPPSSRRGRHATFCSPRAGSRSPTIPRGHYGATFHLNVPDTIAASPAPAKSSAPTLARRRPPPLYAFEGATARAAHGTFVAGELKLSAEQAEGDQRLRSTHPALGALGRPSELRR